MSDNIFHLHMVSDATGETLETMAKAALVQFEGLEVKKHFWPMIRSGVQVERLVEDMKEDPGLVIFTIVNEEIREALIRHCSELGLPLLSVLDPIIDSFADFFGVEAERLPGRQYVLDSDYFERIEALQFSMAHDDGHMSDSITEADIVLVGVSRTSKTPTSIYLANRGYRTANIPYITGQPMPKELEDESLALVIGLTAAPERLIQIRTNRLRSLKESAQTDYVRPDIVADEVRECRRYCSQHGWHVIDVTRRSIEETAAEIITILNRRELEEEKQTKMEL
jgi:regulator of PEP synthase PpsR (kinase-PPPase family)